MRRLSKYRVTFALILGIAAISTSIYVLAKRSSDSATATAALCALRSNLEKRGQDATDFLHAHPHGALGIPPAVIVKSIRDTRETLEALSVLNCEDAK